MPFVFLEHSSKMRKGFEEAHSHGGIHNGSRAPVWAHGGPGDVSHRPCSGQHRLQQPSLNIGPNVGSGGGNVGPMCGGTPLRHANIGPTLDAPHPMSAQCIGHAVSATGNITPTLGTAHPITLTRCHIGTTLRAPHPMLARCVPQHA